MFVQGFSRRFLRAGGAMFVAGVVAGSSPASAQSLTLRSYRDATIRGGAYANTNYGSNAILETRASSDASYLRRAVLQFDTAPYLSTSARISSAKLVLTVKSGNSETRRLSACAVPVSFRESDVTWKKRDSDSYWRNAGGDVVTSDCSSATVTATANSKVTFDVTQQVQKAVSGGYGSRYARFLVGDVGGSSRDSYKQYYSNNTSTSSVRPTLLISTGTSTTSTTSTAPATQTSTSTTSTTTIRVLQWNTHHGGYGTDGRYDTNRLATWIVKMKPDVVMLNEIEKYTGWGNQNQPEVYKNLLQSKTGKTWYYIFAQEYGDWGSNGKGNLILSTVPFRFTDRYEIVHNGDRSVAEAGISWKGYAITLILTHLDPDSRTLRLTQATEVTTFSSKEPETRIITGDMNAWPDQSSIGPLSSLYYDSWTVAKSKGTAYAFSGNTGETKNGRIDYIFYSKNSPDLRVKSSQVYDTRDSNGVMPSDHRPVLTTFYLQ
jgi:endonuclease/exonuclease/phosphatase family metal-dependent hydrolase